MRGQPPSRPCGDGCLRDSPSTPSRTSCRGPRGKKNLNRTRERPDQDSDPSATAKDIEIIRQNSGTAVTSMNRFNAFLLSLWEFVQEQIPFRIPANRPLLKRLKRANSPLKEVTVVDLRPVDPLPTHTDPDHVPQVVIWSHRWRVREHKRRWIDKHGNYRETTVSASVKGPEHLPLIEKDRAITSDVEEEVKWQDEP